MDLNMPGMSGVEADAPHQPMIAPLTRVIVLTISDQDAGRDGRDPRRRVRLPAQGRLDPGADERHPRRPPSGESLISPHDRRQGAPARARHDRSSGGGRDHPAELSDREIQVLKLIANGKDNAMIAGELHISPKTVKNHISNILMKLQIENRIQAAVYAVRSGIV